MIRDIIVAYLARASDYVFSSRNRSRIVLGTDRKTTKTSGYGDGGQNDVESSVVDMVAGFDPSSGDVDLKNDKSRIYIAEKTDPDDYFDIQVGDSVSGEPAITTISDHIRIKGRQTIKIIGKDFSINVKDTGEVAIKSSSKVVIDCSDIRIGSENATEVPAFASKVLSELQKLQIALNAATAGPYPLTQTYIAPTTISQIAGNKTKVE